MNGKIPEAKSILDSIILQDSTNAMAYFEMGRTVARGDKWMYFPSAIN